jgi:hypothetical protein
MKKTFLTILAAGFGFSVAFAQTTPTQENQQEAQVQTEQSVTSNQGEKDRRQVEMSELPQETQDAFKNGEYSDLKVLAIYEITPNAQDVVAMTDKGTIYEFELAQAEEAAAGTTDEGLAGIETERVSARQPDIILHIDDKGQVVKEKNLDEMDKEKKDKKEKQ